MLREGREHRTLKKKGLRLPGRGGLAPRGVSTAP